MILKPCPKCKGLMPYKSKEKVCPKCREKGKQ